MNSLFRSILNKYPDVLLNVHYVLSRNVRMDCSIPTTAISREVKRQIAWHLANKLLDRTNEVFSSTVDASGDETYTTNVYAMTTEELNEILQDVYQAGVNSVEITQSHII